MNIEIFGIVIDIQFKRITQHKLAGVISYVRLAIKVLKSQLKYLNKTPDVYQTDKSVTLTVETLNQTVQTKTYLHDMYSSIK